MEEINFRNININQDINELTNIFIEVYEKPSWNDKWDSHDQAKEYSRVITLAVLKILRSLGKLS